MRQCETWYPRQDEEVLISQAAAGLMVLPGGTAILNVRAQLLLDHQFTELDEYYRVCDGDVIRKKSLVDTCAPGCTAKFTSTKPTENGSVTNSQEGPPLPWLTGLGERIPFDKNTDQTITGTKVLKEAQPRKEPGDYQESIVAHWKLEPVDPCAEVRKLIEQDLAWAEAYLNAALQKQAGASGSKMNELVMQWLKDHWSRTGKGEGEGGREGEGGGDDIQTDMKVEADCEIHGAEDFRKKQRGACKPRIITEALIAHEERHVRQCEWQAKQEAMPWDEPTGEILGNNEGAAYLTGVAKALPWYRDNCPGESATLYARKAALEKKRQSSH
jgi:hypothetical protein